jgi:hypothetical protein
MPECISKREHVCVLISTVFSPTLVPYIIILSDIKPFHKSLPENDSGLLKPRHVTLYNNVIHA